MSADPGDSSEEEISVTVIEALAAAADDDPVAMDPPLFDVIDTDALDALCETGVDVLVAFEYRDHTIEARADGTVTVDGRSCRGTDR